MRRYDNLFKKAIAPEYLFTAWDEFHKGKRNKPDVLRFEMELEQNIFQLHRELQNRTYKHGAYTGFKICDPKLRHIHKATVRDRVVHHAVFKVLNRVFEPTFIADSFSCRIGKGTHKGVARVQQMIHQVSKNQTHPCYALKCDVRKFFDTVDHDILLVILRRRITDPAMLWLLEEIVESYISVISRERERERERERRRAAALAYLSAI
ncbi:MAG: Retron-type reverse transcriptase [Candidatus Andersenbacteria bacterium]|nr:Retron-type reverse transcriptase [Candidatus Andersenbacteria bacterium]MBI3251161.1 Retron-type reverse transcriptase [Candidatus Andersenbacteria bacterium]